MISHSVLERAASLRGVFDSAKPFRHLAIDGFFDAAKIETLIDQFPSFDPDCAINEFGGVGGKDVHERISDVGPAYRDLAAYAASDEMSRFLSDATGIPDLIWGGENMYGGGTYENLHGQGLAVHIDFNRNEPAGLHRRLNVLLYMSTEWQSEWGGALELPADPRNPEDDWYVAFEPFANRVIIHETTESLWLGFRPILLPEDRRHLSRKSIALYFYTADRPAEEIVGATRPTISCRPCRTSSRRTGHCRRPSIKKFWPISGRAISSWSCISGGKSRCRTRLRFSRQLCAD